jgi:phosphoribosyl 1,2-cyclic phosphate phosphodiesterase
MSAATRITATILGCGSSGGVPRIGNDWGACDPKNPKNRRRRCALLVRGTHDGAEGETTVLIDTGCDIREQLLAEKIRHLDAVFYTHEHADHTHGMDDLRVLALSSGERVVVYFPAPPRRAFSAPSAIALPRRRAANTRPSSTRIMSKRAKRLAWTGRGEGWT